MLKTGLIHLINVSINSVELDESQFDTYTEENWTTLFVVARNNGVLPIIIDSLNKNIIKKIPKKLIHSAVSYVVNVENVFQKQVSVVTTLKSILSEVDIHTIILKGITIADSYPIHDHRECGDIDVYLMGKYKEGNDYLVKKGINVDMFNDKHSHILINGVNIDNHYSLFYLGNDNNKRLNDELINLLNETVSLSTSAPPPTFHLLFMLKHTYDHFMREGIGLRHIIDFVCYIKKYRGGINWDYVYKVVSKYKLLGFYNMILNVLNQEFGVCIKNYSYAVGGEYYTMFINSILYEKRPLIQSKNIIKQKIITLSYLYSSRWKYRCFENKGFVELLLSKITK